MKKLLLFLFLLVTSFALSAYVPDPATVFNIKHTSSGFVIGGTTTSPFLQAPNQKPNQAFRFVPVSGKTDTYYLLNENGDYFNKQTTNTGDWWSVAYEKAVNGLNSEWVIVGDATGFRLQLNANGLFLATDAITVGSGIYCDKTADNVNGLYTLEPATVIYESFEVAEKALMPQLEKDYQSYLVNITTAGVSDNIYVTPTAGFLVDKSVITPADVQAGLGKIKMRISTTAADGTVGKIFFAVGSAAEDNRFDTLTVTSIVKRPRYYIINASDTTKVLGTNSTQDVPALRINTGDITQKFLLRPVHEGVNDSLFYILQDGDYKALSKEVGSNWQVIFNYTPEEAIWKIVTQENGTTSSITNFVTGKALGSDGLDVDSRVYDDKTFTASPTAKPYCEWKIVNADVAIVPELFSLSDNNNVLSVEKSFQSYPIVVTTSGIKQTIKISASNGFTVDKLEITPAQVIAGLGIVKVRVSTSATVGTNGTIIFFTDKGGLDTVNVTSIDIEARYYMQNNAAIGMVVGNFPTVNAPALTLKIDTITQKFIVRPLHPALTDSLYYIIQDGDYQMMKKSPSNTYDVIFGGPSVEAVWKIDYLPGRPYMIVINNVTGKALGVDSILVNDRLWDDKTFVASPTAKPYCEWSLIPISGSAVKELEASSLIATVSGQQINIHGTKTGDQIRVYNVVGKLVQRLTAESSMTTLTVKSSGMYLIQVNATTLKVIK